MDSLIGSSIARATFPNILVIDDIMYLKSMRREVYVLARDRQIPLLTVWASAALETAILRNEMRPTEQRVTRDAIERIFTQFEAPTDDYFLLKTDILENNKNSEG